MNGWPQNAYVGQKIVCLADDWWDPKSRLDCPRPAPKLREVVTIAEIYTAPETVCGVAFRLDEYEATSGFAASAFRPVKDTTAAVEALKRIALKPPVPAPSREREPVA